MQRTLVIGDIHGAFTALLQCLERSAFDCNTDCLICLGDVCDRRPAIKECVEELLKIKNLVMILGNHDQWALDWMENKGDPEIWLQQGGSYTVESYKDGVPETHKALFRKAKYYHIENNYLFVHGGIDYRYPINIQNQQNFLWDRSLVNAALDFNGQGIKLTEFEEVFVGHTPTNRLIDKKKLISDNTILINNRSFLQADLPPGNQANVMQNRPMNKPLRICNICLMDTGAGWPGGKLTIMDIKTKEFWQSDALV